MTRHDARDESHDLLTQYLQEIARVPRLTPERERELGFKIRDNNDTDALEELVEANLRFVVSYAKRFRNTHVSFLDLINEGNIGLIQAAKKYDPDKNVKFITYAVWWIRQAILHALSQQGGAFRLPPKRANLMYRLGKAIAAATSGTQPHTPTPDELAAELGITVKEVNTLLQVSADNFSLSAELDDDSHSELGDLIEQTTIPSAEDEMQEQLRKDELMLHLGELQPKEQLVLMLRHGVSDNLPKSHAELAVLLDRPSQTIIEILDRVTRQVCDELEVSPSELAMLLLFTNSNAKASARFWTELPDRPPELSPEIDPHRRGKLEDLGTHATVQRAVDALPLLDRTVLKMRYGGQDEELTLRDIGEILGLSRERVRQIEARAEAKCRRSVRRERR